jgi:dTDP-4-amino-4,6-dideoxygalactose transaminase
MIHYPVPPHLQPAYAGLGLKRGAFPVSEAIHDEILSLPMGPHLGQAEARYVAQSVQGVLAAL